MEVPLLNRRLSSPRAATAIALAAVIAAAIAVTPSFAGSFLTDARRAAHLYLKKQTASRLFVAKSDAPLLPVVSTAASNAVFGPVTVDDGAGTFRPATPRLG